MSETTAGPRARYRQQMRDEVQSLAWEQITEAGASALSLKAIATRLGMSGPALYRYYASRDELLTQLILSTYLDLAELMESVDDKVPSDRLAGLAASLRDWAVSHPQRYLLLFGTPVPGYQAPPEATDLARRIFAPILGGCTALTPSPEAGFDLAIRFWTRLHGVLSLELAGHFRGMKVDAGRLYTDEVQRLLS